MPMTCITGFVKRNGDVEMRLSKIMINYARSWFGLDFVVVGVDWTELILNDPGSGLSIARFGKFGRAFRLIRMIRLLRLLRMREVLDSLSERIQSESTVIGVSIAKTITVISFLAHLMACSWANVGLISAGESWLAATGYEYQPFEMVYFVALHWSLSQFTGGMDEVTPAMSNLSERVYAVVAWFIAFILAAAFLSSLTSSMTQLYIIASADQHKLSSLRRYLSQMEISNGLAARVQRNAQHALREQLRLVSEQSVELLMCISESLRVELHFEMYGPMLSVHPFFRLYTEDCPQIMRKVCHKCVKVHIVSAGDVIFNTGELPSRPQMYLILSGKCRYVADFGISHSLGQGDWVAEAVLWTKWMHRGNFTVTADGKMCIVDAQHFHEIISTFQHRDYNPKFYALEFVKRLNGAEDLSDLLFCEEDRVEVAPPSKHLRLSLSRA